MAYKKEFIKIYGILKWFYEIYLYFDFMYPFGYNLKYIQREEYSNE